MNSCIIKKVKESQKLVNFGVPESRRSAVLKLAYDSSHFGGMRTFEHIIGSALTWRSGLGVKFVCAAAKNMQCMSSIC